MSLKLIPALVAFSILLGGCAQNSDKEGADVPEKGDPNYLVSRDTHAEVYVNPQATGGGSSFREIFIAPLNTAQMQIIQPEGVQPDSQWTITDMEDGVLQNAMADEFSSQLGYESAFNIVNTREEADMIVHTTIVAVHPYATKAQVAAGAKLGGAVTINLALLNAETGEVMVRSVDTKSTDNIWAFNQIDNHEEAINLIFRAWGNGMRRGILSLQGRSSDPLEPTLQMKQQ